MVLDERESRSAVVAGSRFVRFGEPDIGELEHLAERVFERAGAMFLPGGP